MKYKFAISGAANTGYCEIDASQKAEEIGHEVARQNGILITGATTGIPEFAAKGAKEENGIVIGLSPAASYQHHIKTYKLPVDYHDAIIFTGFDYSGRNLLLTKAADAVIVLCGGFGTLNEFTIALEDNKPIGILNGTGGTASKVANLLKTIVDPHKHGAGKVVFADDPKELVAKLVELINKEQKDLKIYPPIGE
ncbi:MAG: LOG family protein [Patescibacteria group bacterium]